MVSRSCQFSEDPMLLYHVLFGGFYIYTLKKKSLHVLLLEQISYQLSENTVFFLKCFQSEIVFLSCPLCSEFLQAIAL